MTEIDNLQGIYLASLKRCSIKKLYGIDLEKLLYNETYFCTKESLKSAIKKAIRSIASRKDDLIYRIDGKELLMVTYKYSRKDHQTYWDEILKIFNGNYDEIEIDEQRPYLRNIDFENLLRNMVTFVNVYWKMRFARFFSERLYLASKVLDAIIYYNELKKLGVKCKVAICFFDSGFHESLIMQFLKLKGCVTITNQHGQPLFRSHASDRLNQSQILNFKCDYFFAKGDFCKEQFVKAGYPSNRIVVVGDVLPIHSFEIVEKRASLIGVFLDCPTYDFAKQSNHRMIQFVQAICKRIGTKYFIKTHPQENASTYQNQKDDNCVFIADRNKTLEELYPLIDIALFHASAIYLDLLKHSIKSYQLKSVVNFDIVRSKNDIVFSEDDFYIKRNEWNNLSNVDKHNYFKKEMDYYVKETNSVSLYKKAVEEIIEANEC